MFKNKKLEVRIVKDESEESSTEVLESDLGFTPKTRENLAVASVLVQDTAKIVSGIIILRFSLRIAEHIIVTRLK